MSDISIPGGRRPAPARKAAAKKVAAAKVTGTKVAGAKVAAPRAPRAAGTPRKATVARRAAALPVPAAPVPAAPSVTSAVAAGAPTSTAPTRPPRRIRIAEGHLPRRLPTLHVPKVGVTLPLPSREQLPFIFGICAVAALNLIEWPVAAIVVIGHTIASHAGSESVRELAEGIESGV
jgi:hypothetical protein